MSLIYKSIEGQGQVEERYKTFLKRWPVAYEHFRIPTSQGETFVVGCGPVEAPPLVLLHGSAANAAMWMGEVRAFAQNFRVYVIDMIGEPGLSAPSRPPLSSDAYADWLDEVLWNLAVERASFVGVSLGGWLTLDYAIRRPHRVNRIAAICPGGVGRQKAGILLMAILLRPFGRWGKRKLMERVFGPAPADPPPALRAFIDFVALIHRHFRYRKDRLPVFSDQALRGLTMPVLAIVGGRDVMLDSAETKARLEQHSSQAEVVYLPEAGHVIHGQTPTVIEFLERSPDGVKSRMALSHSRTTD